MNLDLADRETATEPSIPDPSEPPDASDSTEATDETAQSPKGLPLADRWAIEGSESGA